jgi:hypothetical protein
MLLQPEKASRSERATLTGTIGAEKFIDPGEIGSV